MVFLSGKRSEKEKWYSTKRFISSSYYNKYFAYLTIRLWSNAITPLNFMKNYEFDFTPFG